MEGLTQEYCKERQLPCGEKLNSISLKQKIGEAGGRLVNVIKPSVIAN